MSEMDTGLQQLTHACDCHVDTSSLLVVPPWASTRARNLARGDQRAVNPRVYLEPVVECSKGVGQRQTSTAPRLRERVQAIERAKGCSGSSPDWRWPPP